MNTLFAASLFDNPWIVAIIFIVGALANWLSKRRQEKADGQPGEEPSPSAGQPPAALTLEETLRRLMGEEPPSPPPIPRAARGEDEEPPVEEWQEEESFQAARQTPPPLPPPIPVPVAPASFTAAIASERQAQADRRFEQLSDQGRHPATVVGHRHGHPSRVAKRTAARWRDPRRARQAFVASVVFAPPKSMES